MWLTVHTVHGPSREIPLRGPRMRIGRSKQNDIVIPDASLSRQHAELILETNGWVVRDLGSRNGTIRNGEKLTMPTLLEVGDTLDLGKSHLVFGSLEDESTAAIKVAPESDSERTIHSVPLGDTGERDRGRLLVEAAREVAAHRPPGRTLEALLGLALHATGAERGLVATLSEGNKLLPVASVPAGSAPAVVSGHVVNRVLDNVEALTVEDVSRDKGLAGSETLMGAGVLSVLCAPLAAGDTVRGIFYLDSQKHRASFSREHLEVVSTLAGMADLTLENEAARALAETKRLLDAQIAAAAEIQARLLPPDTPPCPPGYSAAGRLVACHTVGGDLYQFFPWGDGFGAVVADVSGKGLDAALLMANLQARWESIRSSGQPPETWLGLLNDALWHCFPANRFVTLAFAVAGAEGESLLFGSAGHTPALLLDRKNEVQLPRTGPPLGLFPDATFPVEEHPFRPGNRLMLFSDGIPDQQDQDGEEFGLGRLEEIARATAGHTPSAMLSAVLEALEDHAGEVDQDDDMTLAILGRELP